MAYKILMPHTVYGGDYHYLLSRVNNSAVSVVNEKGIEALLVIQNCSQSNCLGFVVRPEIKDGNWSMEEIPYEKLDFSPPPLGYVNAGKSASFLFRHPQRQWRQGHTRDNVSCLALTRESTSYVSYGSKTFYGVLLQPALNIYPPLKETVPFLSTFLDSAAISRDFAVSSEGQLYFRNTEVGKFDLEHAELSIMDKFLFLKESLVEQIGENVNVYEHHPDS